MFALFLTLTVALTLLLWAELRPVFVERAARKARSDRVIPVAPMPQSARRMAAVTTAEPQAESPRASAPQPKAPSLDANDAVMSRIEAMLADTAPATPPKADITVPATGEDLPRIEGYVLGDVIELEIDGALPSPGEIRFEQVGRDAQVQIGDTPVLILEGARARSLSPEMFHFRAART